MTSLSGLNLIFHSIGPKGGMERHVIDLINYASEQGLPVRVVTRHLNWVGTLPQNVEFVVMPDRTPFARLNTLIFELSAFAKCRVEWPTIAISRVPGAEMSIVGGTHKGHLLDRKKRHTGLFDYKTIDRERAMYHQAKVIVAHSAKVADEIVCNYNIPSQKIITLYPPVDTTVFSLSARKHRDAMRNMLGVNQEQFLLLFPSNNHELKGADLIVESLKGFDPRVKLVVAGKSPLHAPNAINLGLFQDMPALYAAADAVILASQYEAFGLVGPEAVLCGTPAIFANTIGAVEVMSESACIRFDRTVLSLRTALKKAIEKFDEGTLVLHEPAKQLLYPFSPSQHFDIVFNLLATTKRQ